MERMLGKQLVDDEFEGATNHTQLYFCSMAPRFTKSCRSSSENTVDESNTAPWQCTSLLTSNLTDNATAGQVPLSHHIVWRATEQREPIVRNRQSETLQRSLENPCTFSGLDVPLANSAVGGSGVEPGIDRIDHNGSHCVFVFAEEFANIRRCLRPTREWFRRQRQNTTARGNKHLQKDSHCDHHSVSCLGDQR